MASDKSPNHFQNCGIISACAAEAAKDMQKMGKTYFVSGIDTGIGKTAVTGLMARWLASRGRDVITVKMVQTGNDGFSEDLDMHRAIMGAGKFREDIEGLTAPQIFKFPSSPLLAASLEGKTVDADEIARSVRLCAMDCILLSP